MDDCTKNPTQACIPESSLAIGKWINQGQVLNDANLTGTGDPFVLTSAIYQFRKAKLKGSITTRGILTNSFTDTTSTSLVALTGGSGKFFGVTGEIVHKSLGPLGDFNAGTSTVALRERIRFVRPISAH